MPVTLIRPLTIDDAPACDAVLATLPTFFGDADGIRDCAVAVRTQRGFVATINDVAIGFITVLAHIPGSAEITWLAVHAEHRRHGIGTLLVDAATDTLRDEGAAMSSRSGRPSPNRSTPKPTITKARADFTSSAASSRSANWRSASGTARQRSSSRDRYSGIGKGGDPPQAHPASAIGVSTANCQPSAPATSW